MEKKHPFSPLYDSNSKILILGSLPSVASVNRGFYYMHPENRFWKMLSKIYHEDAYSMPIEEKRLFILKHQLALYDVIASCTIKQSSDASIKNACCTDITYILKEAKISKILLNGKTAYKLFIKTYPELESITFCMPSTSSANAKISLEKLVEIWSRSLQA